MMASRVRMAVTRNSVITFRRGLAAPAPPPVDETEGGELTVFRESDEVTGELAVSREGCKLAVSRESGEVTGELAAPRKGGEVTGELAISREVNNALLVNKLEIEITEERKKQSKAEHKYVEIGCRDCVSATPPVEKGRSTKCTCDNVFLQPVDSKRWREIDAGSGEDSAGSTPTCPSSPARRGSAAATQTPPSVGS
jgi:hypothetical protein